jgi:hypothetical protein
MNYADFGQHLNSTPTLSITMVTGRQMRIGAVARLVLLLGLWMKTIPVIALSKGMKSLPDWSGSMPDGSILLAAWAAALALAAWRIDLRERVAIRRTRLRRHFYAH